MKRRDFLKKATTTTVAGAAVGMGCSSEPANKSAAIHSSKTYEWQMVTTWPPGFPVMGEGAEMLAKWVEEISQGQLKISVFGAGELVPAFQTFEAVQQGNAQMGHGAAYYWAGKSAAAPFFAAVPFGMNTQQMNAWVYCGGGLKLWEELYAPFNLIPMPAGNTGMQMGGWFNKKIESTSDLKGLKMRIPGLGGKVISRAGGTGLSTPGAEIYTNLDRGVIDATEWVGPYHDFKLGLYKIAKYYYYPGWHEPTAMLELIVNKGAFEGLPPHLQQAIRTAAYRANVWMHAEFEAKNIEYLQKLINEHNVKLVQFPADVLAELKKLADEVIAELVETDPMSQKVYAAYSEFRKNISSWADITEKVYYEKMNNG